MRCNADPSCKLDGLTVVVPVDSCKGSGCLKSSTLSLGIAFGCCFWIFAIRPGTGPRFFLASSKVHFEPLPVHVLHGLDMSQRTLRSLFEVKA
jgi:hypothetical protein